MKLLIVQHEVRTSPGSLLDWAQDREIEVRSWWPAEGAPAPELGDDEVVFVCGGSMDTFETEKFPWLKTEKTFLNQVIDEGRKVFGICLGAQLLCECLGGTVKKMPQWEIGWWPVESLRKPKTSILGFHWHRYECELPPGAVLELTNRACKVQGFRWDGNVEGMQFHPEADLHWIETALEGVKWSQYHGYVQNEEFIRARLREIAPLKDWFYERLDLWLRRT